jgi:hypothetical protein
VEPFQYKGKNMDQTNVSPLPGGSITDRVGSYVNDNTSYVDVFIGNQNLGTTNWESNPKDDTIADTDGAD